MKSIHRPLPLKTKSTMPQSSASAAADRLSTTSSSDAGDPVTPLFSPHRRSFSDADDDDQIRSIAFDLFDRRLDLTIDPFPQIHRDLGLAFHPQIYDGGDREVVAPADDFLPAQPGLRVSALDSDSDGGDGGVPLCWDCLRFDDDDDRRDFEWEQIGDESENPSPIIETLLYRDHDDRELEINIDDEEDVEGVDSVDRTIEWEVLMSVNNLNGLGRSVIDPDEIDAYFVEEQEGFVYASDYDAYEVLFGQFAEEGGGKGGPPAAKLFVENLPSVVVDEGVVGKDCAVCKDSIVVEERVKRLPCLHHYHEECILPWLRIRNTCPLCRFELPTDDPEYEKWKAGRDGVRAGEDEAGLRYDFELLPD